MDKSSNDFSEKRESVRIPDAFLISYKIISKKEYEGKTPFYKSRRTIARPIEKRESNKILALDWSSLDNETDISPSLIKMLSYLDKKLNLILSQQGEILKNISAGKEIKEEYEKGKCIDISGEGTKMHISKELKKGTMLELCIEPPIYPPIDIVALGEIIKVQSKNKNKSNDFEISLKFVVINEDDKEDLIKYIYKRQRELISQRKRNEGQG